MAIAVSSIKADEQFSYVSVNTMGALKSDHRPICVVNGGSKDYLVSTGLQEGIDFVVKTSSYECYQLMNSSSSSVIAPILASPCCSLISTSDLTRHP